MRFSETTYTAPSGAFQPVVVSPNSDLIPGSFGPVYNPSVLDDFTASYSIKRTFELGSDDLDRAKRKYGEPVTTAQFDHYSHELVSVTNHLLLFAPHCSLAPLRGAAMPCSLIQVMSRGAVRYDFFDFRDNSDTTKHPRFIQELTEILRRRDPAQEDYRINVTDTSRGGNGINNLVNLLVGIKAGVPRFANQHWSLDLNLLNDRPTKAHIDLINRVRKLKEQYLAIQLRIYKVSSLIVEDVEAALAFDVERDAGYQIFTPRRVPLEYLCQIPNQVNLIETDNAYLAFEGMYSPSITEQMITSPYLHQVGVVWPEYQNKN